MEGTSWVFIVLVRRFRATGRAEDAALQFSHVYLATYNSGFYSHEPILTWIG